MRMFVLESVGESCPGQCICGFVIFFSAFPNPPLENFQMLISGWRRHGESGFAYSSLGSGSGVGRGRIRSRYPRDQNPFFIHIFINLIFYHKGVARNQVRSGFASLELGYGQYRPGFAIYMHIRIPENIIYGKKPGLRIRIRSDLLIFGLPDPDPT
mgnify:CR=1 FL=1